MRGSWRRGAVDGRSPIRLKRRPRPDDIHEGLKIRLLARKRWILWVVLAAALIPSVRLAWEVRDMPHFGCFHDDSIYLVTAKSLAEGRGYRILSFPGEPYQTKYPPLYPALLAAIWKLAPEFPRNLPWFLILSWVSYLLFLIACWAAFRKFGFGAARRAALTAAVALTPVIAYYSTAVMPDLLFCAVLLAALMAAERSEPRWAALAGLLGGLAFLLKTLALPLAATVPLYYSFRKRFRAAGAFLATMTPFAAGWFAWVQRHSESTSDLTTLYYTQYLRYHFEIGAWDNQALIVWKNFAYFFSEFGGLLVADLLNQGWGFHVARVLTAAAIAGVIRLAREGRFPQYALFGAAFFVQALVWHYPPGERFLFSVTPLLVAGLYREASNVTGAIRRAWRSGEPSQGAAAAVFATLLVVLGTLALVRNGTVLLKNYPDINRQQRQLLASRLADYRWMVSNLSPKERVLSYYDPVLYLYTGMQSCRLTIDTIPLYREEPEKVREIVLSAPLFARRHQMRYVYITDVDFHAELPVDECVRAIRTLRQMAAFQPVRKSPHGVLYSLQ